MYGQTRADLKSLQAIVLLNDPQLLEAARVLAESLVQTHGDEVGLAIRELMLRLATREPTELEQQKLLNLYEQQHAYFVDNPEEAAALLKLGQRATDAELAATDVAAMTIVVSTAMNLDACVTKR